MANIPVTVTIHTDKPLSSRDLGKLTSAAGNLAKNNNVDPAVMNVSHDSTGLTITYTFNLR